MAYDFATFLRLSPERLCDFPARVCDFDRAADLPTRSAAFPFLRLIGGGFYRGGVGAAVFAKNLDFLLYLRLTSKCKYAILYLPKGSKYKLNFERGLYHEKDF
jgi:hypothetical protein